MKSTPPSASGRRARRGWIRAFIARAVLLTFFAGSVWLLWWSINRLPPVSSRATTLSRQIAHATEQIETLERAWTPDAEEALTNQFAASRAALVDAEGLAAWQQELRQHAHQLSLQMKLDFGEPLVEPFPGSAITIRPALLEIEPLGSAPKFPYQRILELNKRLGDDKRRIEVVELTVEGESNSVSHAKQLLWVWSANPGTK